jgi:hypothetical protein
LPQEKGVSAKDYKANNVSLHFSISLFQVEQ